MAGSAAKGRGGAPGPATPGQLATAARDAIALAFDEIGGVAALAEWVMASEDNRKIFYTNLYPKIISSQPGGEPEIPMITEIRRTIVRPGD
jgi:hypothetical protein